MFNQNNKYKDYLNYKKLLEQSTICPFKAEQGSFIVVGEKDLVPTKDVVYKNNSLEFNVKSEYPSFKAKIEDNDILLVNNQNQTPSTSQIQIGFDKKKVFNYNILTIDAKSNDKLFAFNIGSDYAGGGGYLNIKKSSDTYVGNDISINEIKIIKKFQEPNYNLKIQSSQKDVSNAYATSSQIFRTQVNQDDAFHNEIMSEGAIVLEPNKTYSHRHKNEGKLQYEMNFYLNTIDTSSNLLHNEYQGILSENNEIPFISLVSDSSNSSLNQVRIYNDTYFDKNIGIGTKNPRSVLDISKHGVIIIPSQSNAQEDEIDGAICFNPDKNVFEGYKSGRWGTLGGVDDSSGTFITAVDISSGNINKKLQFFTDGVKRMTIDGSGNIVIQNGNLDISKVNYYTYTNIQNDLVIKDNIIEIGRDDVSDNSLNKGIIFSSIQGDSGPNQGLLWDSSLNGFVFSKVPDISSINIRSDDNNGNAFKANDLSIQEYSDIYCNNVKCDTVVIKKINLNGNETTTFRNVVNNVDQTFIELITQQPRKFKIIQQSNIGGKKKVTDYLQTATQIFIKYTIEDLIPKDKNTNQVLYLNWLSDPKARHLPYIDKICIDISGFPYPSNIYTGGGWNSQYINKWVRYKEIDFQVTGSYNYELDFNKIGKNDWSNGWINDPSKAANAILIRPFNSSDKKGLNGSFNFDIRIYGINNAEIDWKNEQNQYIDLNNDRMLMLPNIYFITAHKPNPPILLTITNNNSIGNKLNITSYTDQIISGTTPNDPDSGIIAYDIRYIEYETFSAWNSSTNKYNFGNILKNENIYNTDISTGRINLNSEQYVDMTQPIVSNISNLRYGSRYNIALRYINDQNDKFSLYGENIRYNTTQKKLIGTANDDFYHLNPYYGFTKIPKSLPNCIFGNQTVTIAYANTHFNEYLNFNDKDTYSNGYSQRNLVIKGETMHGYYLPTSATFIKDTYFVFEITPWSNIDLICNSNNITNIGKDLSNTTDFAIELKVEKTTAKVTTDGNLSWKAYDEIGIINHKYAWGENDTENLYKGSIFQDISSHDMYLNDLNKKGFRRIYKFKFNKIDLAASSVPYKYKFTCTKDSITISNEYIIFVDQNLPEPQLGGNFNSPTFYETYKYCCGIKSIEKFNILHDANTFDISYIHSNLKAVPDHSKLVDIYLDDSSAIFNLHSKKVRYDRNTTQTTHNTYIVPHDSFSVLNNNDENWDDVEYSIKGYFYKDNINVIYKMYNLTSYDGKIQQKTIQPNYHCDYNSFDVSNNKITSPKTPSFYEISNNIMSNMNTDMYLIFNNLLEYTDHTKKIQDNTLLYYKGEFQTPTTTTWLSMNGVNHHTGDYPRNISNISYDLLGVKETNGNYFKWIAFKYDTNSYVQKNTSSKQSYFDLSTLLSSKFNATKRTKILNLLKVNTNIDDDQWKNQNIIGLIIKQIGANWICGNIRLMYQTNTIWSVLNANKSLNNILTDVDHGCKIYDPNNENVHILVNGREFPSGSNFYVLLGIKNNYSF